MPPDLLNLPAIRLVIVELKLASSFSAAASSFKVSNAAGAPSTNAFTAAVISVVVLIDCQPEGSLVCIRPS